MVTCYLTSECVCANSFILWIRGQKKKKKNQPKKQVKTKEFRWRGGRDLPTDFMENMKF